MTVFQGRFRWAAMLVLFVAVLHIVALMTGGFTSGVLRHGVLAVTYLLIAVGLGRGLRWLAYIAFIGVFIGASVAMTGIWALGAVSGWMSAAIALTNLLAAAALLIALWRNPEAQPG